jgi:iron complex outermembrane receptor protein
MKSNKIFKLSLLAIATSTVANTSLANETELTTEIAKNEQIEVIMVTSQKRYQRLIDVPTSIAVVTADTINNSSAQQLVDIADLVPNLDMEDVNSFNNKVSIRGVGSHSRNISFDTRVGVYLDGVYLGQSPGLNQELMDIERIEVLRGPQGSLFGKNTVAGAINITTLRPADNFEAKVKVRIGNYNAQQVNGYVNALITDDVFLKVSANSLKRDGFVDNLHPDALGDVGDKNNQSFRAQLLVESIDNLSLMLTLDGSSADETPLFGEHITDTLGLTPVEAGAAGIRTTYNDFLPSEDRDSSGISFEAIYEFSDGSSFKSITAQRDVKLNFIMDLDYSSLNIFSLNYTDEYDQFTQEFQYTSNLGGKVEFILGAYYYQQDSFTDRSSIPGDRDTIINLFDNTFLAASLAGTGLSTFEGTPFEELYPLGENNHIGTVDTQSYALFTNITYDFSAQWQLSLGMRWGEETKKVDWFTDGTKSGLFQLATANVVDKKSDSDFLPSIALNYNYDSNNVFYARIATGSKSGGYNLDFITAAQLEALEFDKESSINYELGFKGYNNDQSLSYAFTMFKTNYDDYQQTQFIDLGDSRTIIAIANAAEVATDGVEVELSVKITDNFTLGLAASYLDASFDKFENGGTADDPDVSGNRLPESSKVQAVMMLDYSAEINETSHWFAHLDISHTGDQYTTTNNVKKQTLITGDVVDFGYLPSRTAVNAKVGVQNDDWTVSLWVRNLADNDDIVYSRRQFLGGIDQGWNAPRTYGVDVTYNF